MEDNPELALKKLCCTCLSSDRKLVQLCRLHDGVNNLYSLLSYDSEAYREGFYKEATSLHVCWECEATLRRLARFRWQACMAQRRLTCIEDGREIKTLTTCFSRLLNYHKTAYDAIIVSDSVDNFIDCGPDVDVNVKIEKIDIDDIPLSELHDNCISDCDSKSHIETNENEHEAKKKVKHKTKKKIDSKISENNILSEEKTLRKRVKRKEGSGYINASYKCGYCAENFKSHARLTRHVETFHLQSESKPISTVPPTSYVYPCAECNKCFDNRNQRWKHVQRHHREGHKCATCGKRFAFRNNLSRHELAHKGPPPRKQCPTCHKLIRIDLLKVHSQIHSERDKHTCVECAKTFVSRASYEHHLKYTQAHAKKDILKYKCTVCDKGYRSRGELRDHVNYQHIGRTQHKCPVCGKALATRRCITRHVKRAHQGVKEGPRDKICQQCGKAFRDKKGLREHEFIHTGERPLSCEVCGATFRQHASLYTHRKRVHKMYPTKRTVELVEKNNETVEKNAT